jgi:1,4-dihydroxy-2-naphthoate octaprenyltransferase
MMLADGFLVWSFAGMKNRLNVWFRAFRGFYSPEDPIAKEDFVARFLFSARSIILVISAQAAVIAGLLAYISGAFNWFYFLLILLAFVTIHAASNLMNDYFGFLRGHDLPQSPRRRYTLHPLADKILTKTQVKAAIGLLLLLNALIAAFFTMIRGLDVLVFAAVGLLMMLLYDASPRPLKSIGLGEVASFVVWGPLMIFGGYFIITGRLSLDAFLVSIPYGLGVMSILLGKHIDQETYDAGKDIKTMPVILGDTAARLTAVALVLLMYLFTFVSVVYGALSVTAILVVLNYDKLVEAVRVLSKPRPTQQPKGYVGWPLWYHRQCLLHNKGFGWFYIGALAIAAILANTPLSKYEFLKLILFLVHN